MKKIGLFGPGLIVAGLLFPLITFGSVDTSYRGTPAHPPITLTAQFVPSQLPNTGFPPLTSATVAFAAVLLIAAGLAVTPYAKKITAALR